MRRSIRAVTFVFTLGGAIVVATGCASTQASPPSLSASVDQLTEADIQQANVATAYDAVDRLRRRWFRDLSGNASGDVVVYVHTDQKLGGKETLRDIPARDVMNMRYLKSADAVARYGASASGGAIVVTRR